MVDTQRMANEMCVMREDLGLLIISIRSLGAWRDAFDPAARQTIAESCATPQTRSIRMKSSSQNNFLARRRRRSAEV
jgi:hypothetical protein